MKVKKENTHIFNLSPETVRHHLYSSVCQYLYESKPNWYDLIDKNGRKLICPPVWQHGSTVNLPSRVSDHDKHLEVLSEDQLSRSVIQKYIRNNNLVLSADYYFNISVLDFTQLFWCFELEYRCNRHDAVSYKNALEAVMKTDISKWFVVDEKSLEERFNDVWGIDYRTCSIEEIKTPSQETVEKANKVLQFMDKLAQNESTKKVVDNALRVLTVDEALSIAKQRYEFRKNNPYLNKDIVTKFTPIF